MKLTPVNRHRHLNSCCFHQLENELSMPNESLTMRMIREILRLHHSCGLSKSKISQALGCARTSVRWYIKRAQAAGLAWPLPQELDDDELLEKHLYPQPSSNKLRPHPDCSYMHQELQKKGVTLALLWEEYRQDHPDGYQLSQFREIYRQWSKTVDLVMRLDHKAGEKAFSDFAGTTLPIVDENTGLVTPAHLFVCALGASNYTYARLFWREDCEAWCTGQALALEFFNGSVEILVPDNPKPVVTKASPYEPDINPSFAQMASHFGVAVIPARVRRPKDKAIVEAAVGLATRWILAVLRNRTFHSLGEANQAVEELLVRLNDKSFKKMPGSRRSRYEEVDKPALKPLPKERYEYTHIKFASVHIADYHVEYDRCWYSVPHAYRGRKVEVRATYTTVEIFLKGKRIASHARHFVAASRSTVNEHRPKEHRQYGDWPPERILRWAAKIGPATKAVTEKLMDRQQHPELGFRACFGILRLAKVSGNERLEAACQRAIAINAYSFKSIKSILDSGMDKRPMLEKPRQLNIVSHENLRGPSAFTAINGGDQNANSSNTR
jgi:transposase